MADQTDYTKIRREAEQEANQELRDAEIRRQLSIQQDAELGDIEDEIGMTRVPLDENVLASFPSDDTDDNLDVDDDGVEDAADLEPAISDLPPEDTESYGTGLQGKPSDRAGIYSRRDESLFYNNPDAVLTGGDIDANYEQASVVGDEAVGGTVSTPDQDIVDELGAAVGLEMDDRSFLRTNDVLNERDDRRWELDPQSSEDYEDR